MAEMLWSSQDFEGSTAITHGLCTHCNAQPDLEPAWQRPACLLEMKELRRWDDVYEFIRENLRIPIPNYGQNGNIPAKNDSYTCYKLLHFFFYQYRIALDRCLMGIWDTAFKTKGNAKIEDLLPKLKEARADQRRFSTKRREDFDSIGSTESNNDVGRMDSFCSLNTSFTTTSSTTSPDTSFSKPNAPITPQTSFSSVSDSMDNVWQKVRVAKRCVEVHEPSKKQKHHIEPLKDVIPGPGKTDSEPKRLENHAVSAIPGSDLFVDDIPISLLQSSSALRWELTRLSAAYEVSLINLASFINPNDGVYDDLWARIIAAVGQIQRNETPLRLPRSSTPIKTRIDAWNVAEHSPNVVRTGKLSFRQLGAGSVFKLNLNPLVIEAKSHRFARKFGAHRFLHLSIPSLKHGELPAHLSGQTTNLKQRLQEWLLVPDKKFMGYSWTAFCTRANKTTKKAGKRKDAEEFQGFTVILFATKGYGLEEVDIGLLLNWFIPLQLNASSTVCKAFARIDLGLSKTYPTIVFAPSQVHRVADHVADGTPEDSSLNDPSLTWSKPSDLKAVVMNDGCSRISMAAAKQAWECLKQAGPVPSAFQARIGPYKGVWMISEPGQTTASEDVWIEVSDSQRKFRPHNEDLIEETYDPLRLTFEIVTWSRKPSPSVLYRDYLSILEDRGISKTSLEIFLVDHFKKEKQKLEAAMNDPQQSYKWLQDNFSTAGDRGDSAVRDLNPNGLAPTMKVLLESGFEVNKSPYLGRQFQNLVSWNLSQLSGSLNVELGKSTMVIGIADPIGCLKPNEIHLAFSSNFSDNISDYSYNFLHNVDALVARHPSLRRSDIQKVHATYKMELRHLVDVVVFPRTGTSPLAGKLQGGDYDGDTFWVCWEPSIVDPFHNAPTPLNAKKPEHFGIQVDRTTIEDISTQSDSLKQFFRRSFEFAWQANFLGVSTNFHTKLCYNQNSVSTAEAESVADIHDYLVDSAKNGYSFGQEAWEHFRKSLRRAPTKLNEPAYKTASEMDLQRSNGDRDIKFDTRHVIDYLVFHVARRDARAILASIKKKLGALGTPEDESISSLWLSYASRPEFAVEVRRLGEELKVVYQKWPRWSKSDDNDKDKRRVFNDAKVACRSAYDNVRTLSCLEEDTLSRAALQHMPFKGDLLKASAAFHLFSNKGAFVFAIAGYHIRHLKAYSQGVSHTCVPRIFEKLKMRKLDLCASAEVTEQDEQDTSDVEAETGGVQEEHSDSDVFYDAVMDVDE